MDERLAYRVLTGPDDRSFCERVSAALADGYELHGAPGDHLRRRAGRRRPGTGLTPRCWGSAHELRRRRGRPSRPLPPVRGGPGRRPRRRAHQRGVDLRRAARPGARWASGSCSSSGSGSPTAPSTAASSTSCARPGSPRARRSTSCAAPACARSPRPRPPPPPAWARPTTSLEGFEGPHDEHGRAAVAGWKIAGLPWRQG